MKPAGINMQNVKLNNRSSVLKLLLNSSMSRTDLAAKLDLTTATLTTICNEFIAKGLIIEEEPGALHTAGRKKRPLSINPVYRYVLAINLHYTGNVISICDLCANRIASTTFPVDPKADPSDYFERLSLVCVKLLWENSIPLDRVLGAGVCVIGPVDESNGVALNPFNMFSSPNIEIQRYLEKYLPFPVRVENNVCSFLIAEFLYGIGSTDENVLAVRWGPGVGSAFAANGTISKNKLYHSTAVGHMCFVPDHGVRCKCGRYGCLETCVSITSIAQKIHGLAESDNTVAQLINKFGVPDLDNITAFIDSQYQPILDILDGCAKMLAIGICNTAQVLSPDKIILYGKLFWSDFLSRSFFKYINNTDYGIDSDSFTKSGIENRIDYIGASSIAVKYLLVETGGNPPANR
jgi:transcriptional regulator of PTS gene